MTVADIGYAVAHAEGQVGTEGAVGIFVEGVVLGSIELDFTTCVDDNAVAAYQQVLIVLYGDLAAAEAT